MSLHTDLASASDRRAPARRRIRGLIEIRNQLLRQFSDLIARRPFRQDPALIRQLHDFCQSLIDYAAAAHFQLYRYVAENRERRQEVQEIAGAVYEEIAGSTDAFLAFNDKYTVDGAEPPLAELEQDLAHIGDLLDARITDEDRVIAVLQ